MFSFFKKKKISNNSQIIFKWRKKLLEIAPQEENLSQFYNKDELELLLADLYVSKLTDNDLNILELSNSKYLHPSRQIYKISNKTITLKSIIK